MRILIDILHPAHVHLFKHFIRIMEEKGHDILITAREKDVTIDLLKSNGLHHIIISKLQPGKLRLLQEFFSRTRKLHKICKKFKPDLLLGDMGPSISIVGKLRKIPCLIMYNNECATLTNFFAYPLASAVCTPDSYYKKVNGNHFTYPGCHELAYLRPEYYQPDSSVLDELGIKDNEKYFVVRFVSWQASHDINQKGFSLEIKRKIVHLLKQHGRVIITSETKLPEEFEKYRMAVSPEKIHDVLYYAQMYVGEGATTASEAAVLGTPAVYINNLQFGYLLDHEKYGLAFNFKFFGPAFEKIKELLEKKDLKVYSEEKRQKILFDKVDLTSWMVDFVEGRKWENKNK